MFGKVVEKYCETCERGITAHISRGYWIKGKLYCLGFYCPTCHADLSEEDSRVLEQARKSGQDIREIMY